MSSLHDLDGQTFSWRPVKGRKKTIELYAGTSVFGTLQQPRGAPAVGVTEDGRWQFEKEKGRLTVRGEDGSVTAIFTPTKGGQGSLVLADDTAFRWAPTRRGTGERAFFEAEGLRVVRFWRDWHLLRVEDRGAADPGMVALPDFPLLVVLGRVIGIGTDDDLAITAAIIATSA